jgi:hypothetical protein
VTLRRPRARRREVIVFTEGEATEVSYVDAIKRLQDGFAVRVDDRHGEPETLVRLAIAEKRRRARLARQEAAPPEEVPLIWCMFDRDQHPNVDALIRQAIDADIGVAFSHPCFELWLMLHFRDRGASEAGVCAGLVDAVEAQIPGFRRRGKRVTLADLADRYPSARERARGLAKRHERDGLVLPTQRDPSTGVAEFVEALGITY